MLHPIIQTLTRVHAHLRALPSARRREIAIAVGLSPNALRHAAKECWEPRAQVLAALDVALTASEREHNGITTVPFRKVRKSTKAPEAIALQGDAA